MKSQFQTLSFLSNYTPKTSLDKEFISSFLVQRFQITPRTLIETFSSHGSPLDVTLFISWFKNGLSALKTAKYGDSIVLLGNCTLETCQIIASLAPEGSILTDTLTVPVSEILPASTEDELRLQAALSASNLQPSPNTLTLVPKYIPQPEDRVTFFDWSMEVQGVGVVREITAEGDVVFFCYFTYPTASQEKKLGYNLHETPGYNLASMVFENIDKENIQTTLGNSTSCFRRMGRELERVGKVWKDKLLRIEPMQVEVEVGGKYYYISDKLDVITETEKGTPTSHKRYLAGNYFTSLEAATEMLGKINDMLRGYLASPRWPEVL